MAKTSQISGETTLFFQKKIAKTPPYFWVACRQLWRNLYEFVWGIDTSPVLLQYKKWPNKKKTKKTGDGV